MAQRIVIQNVEMMNRRVEQQLREGRVDVAQYHGGTPTAIAWATMADDGHPLRHFDCVPGAELLPSEFGVVDLGPGSGKPCLNVIHPIMDRVRSLILVDVSPEMLTLAEKHIESNTDIEVTSIVADFLLDINPIRTALNRCKLPLVFLCLGRTAGNFTIARSFTALQALMNQRDYLILDLGLYPTTDPQQALQKTADFYTSEQNCQFGLRFLEACGVSASSKNTYSEITEDPQDPGIFIITTYYRFPTDTSLSIGNESLLFRQGQSLRWLESRRFDKHKVERHLTKYGLQSFGYKDLDNHALFLCGTHHHHRV